MEALLDRPSVCGKPDLFPDSLLPFLIDDNASKLPQRWWSMNILIDIVDHDGDLDDHEPELIHGWVEEPWLVEVGEDIC